MEEIGKQNNYRYNNYNNNYNNRNNRNNFNDRNNHNDYNNNRNIQNNIPRNNNFRNYNQRFNTHPHYNRGRNYQDSRNYTSRVYSLDATQTQPPVINNQMGVPINNNNMMPNQSSFNNTQQNLPFLGETSAFRVQAQNPSFQ